MCFYSPLLSRPASHPQTEKYGLSFIKLHSPPKASDEDGGPSATSPAQPIKLGSFSLKDDPKDLPSGSLFFHREHETAPVVPEASTATKARMASTVALKSDLSKSPRAAAKSSRADSRVVKSSPSGDATAAKRGASSSGLKRAAKQVGAAVCAARTAVWGAISHSGPQQEHMICTSHGPWKGTFPM